MVARIIPSNSLRNTLNYNEHKVKAKVAECIHAVNYPKDLDKLGYTDKLNRLQKLAVLNARVTKNSVHISLNFDPSEKLTREQYQQIAEKYMEGIGYGAQPYLVYEHLDSGHPHLHIVTTNVQGNGKRIASNNIGRNESEQTRKAIEKEFGLVEAEKQKLTEHYQLSPLDTGKFIYGKGETKKEIQNRLAVLLPRYKYCSLSALNALLRQYNIVADPGSENSRIKKHGGLVYRALDKDGKPVGVGIKASSFYMKPTLKYLEKVFEQNGAITIRKERRIRNAVELAFQNQKIRSLSEFKTALKGDHIDVHFWRNDKDLVYGITYIDHQSKWVLNGSEVGKAYTSNAIKNRLVKPVVTLHPVTNQRQEFETHFFVRSLTESFRQAVYKVNLALTAEEPAENLAYELRQDARRRRKKKQLRQ